MIFSWLNSPVCQEASVTILIVGRILMGLRGIFNNEAKGLIFLTVISLLVEIISKNGRKLQFLNFRATKTSGILLGSVTLPLVMASRMTLLMRKSLEESSQLGLERARMEFWTSIACSSALLLQLASSLTNKVERGKKRKDRSWDEGLVMTMTILGVSMAGIMSLVWQLGLHTRTVWYGCGTGMVWYVSHALGSAALFYHLPQAFPSSTSPGEAMLVSHGLSLFIGNALIFSLRNLVPQFGLQGTEDPVGAMVQAIVLGMLMVPLLYTSLLNTLSLKALEMTGKKGKILEYFPKAVVFYLTVLIVILCAAPAWLQSVAEISEHPIVWMWRYVLDEPGERLGLCAYWILVMGVFSLFLHQMAVKQQVARIMVRKGFHVLAVLMFVPALMYQPGFLRLSFALALGVFVVVETVRIWRIPPFGEHVHGFLKAFTDSRDSGVLIISHFSLLLGCAIPVWLSSTLNPQPLAAYAGILSLGIGDTMASVIGYNYGSLRLNNWSKKTLEGTIAGILSTIGASLILSFCYRTPPPVGNFWSIVIGATGAGLVEAFTSQLDNAFVPIIFYALLSLSEP